MQYYLITSLCDINIFFVKYQLNKILVLENIILFNVSDDTNCLILLGLIFSVRNI